MPRLKKSEEQQADTILRAAIKRQQTMFDYNESKVASVMGVSVETYRRRRRSPENLTLGELRTLCKKLKLTDRDICLACGVTYRGTTPWEGLP